MLWRYVLMWCILRVTPEHGHPMICMVRMWRKVVYWPANIHAAGEEKYESLVTNITAEARATLFHQKTYDIGGFTNQKTNNKLYECDNAYNKSCIEWWSDKGIAQSFTINPITNNRSWLGDPLVQVYCQLAKLPWPDSMICVLDKPVY